MFRLFKRTVSLRRFFLVHKTLFWFRSKKKIDNHHALLSGGQYLYHDAEGTGALYTVRKFVRCLCRCTPSINTFKLVRTLTYLSILYINDLKWHTLHTTLLLRFIFLDYIYILLSLMYSDHHFMHHFRIFTMIL